jgi:recombination protein RecT
MSNAVQTKDMVTAFKNQISNNEREFKAALPAHIPVERFMRVVTTAVTSNADLLQADRRSLFEAATKAAQDGLLPDGREGALVIYNTKVKEGGKEFWIKKVQWMPMIAGILKKVRNSGELSTIVARVVYAGDKFRNWIDDTGEHIEYEAGDEQDQDVVRKVFAMAKLKDGSIEVEVLSPNDIEKIRAASRSKDKGPWVDWWPEMAKKSAIRRLAKRLPMSTDLDDLIRRDDALYDFEGAREDARIAHADRPTSLSARLDALASPSEPAHDSLRPGVADPETGEITQDDSETGAEGDTASQAAGAASGDRDSAAAASAADSPDKSRLLAEAEAAADKGRRVFDQFWTSLEPFERGDLKEHSAALTARANKVDGRVA